MPGRSQLEKLAKTILTLGNEINLRNERGEKAFPVKIPEDIPDIDDSEDFVLGMPEKPKPPEEEEAEEEAPAEESPDSDAAESSGIDPDALFGAMGSGLEMPDLSAFNGADSAGKKSSKKKGKAAPPAEEKKEPEPPPKPKGISGSGYSGFGFDDDGNLENASKDDGPLDIGALMGGPGKPAVEMPKSGAKSESAPSSSSDLPDLDALLNGVMNPEPEKAAVEEPTVPETPAPEKSADALGDIPGLDDIPGISDIDGALSEAEPTELASAEPEPAEPAPAEPSASGLGDIPGLDDLGSLGDLGDLDISGFEDVSAPSDSSPLPDVSAPEEVQVTENPPPPETEEFSIGGTDGGLDGLDDLGFEVEEYTPPSETAAVKKDLTGGFDADAMFGTDIDESGIPEKKEEEKPKPVYKAIPVEDDFAILKPDIFTDNPVTGQNPPYYVTAPYGQIPEEILNQEKQIKEAAEGKPGANDAGKNAPSAKDAPPAEAQSSAAAAAPNDAEPDLSDFEVEDYVPETAAPSDTATDFDMPDLPDTAETAEAADSSVAGAGAGSIDDFNLDDIADIGDSISDGNKEFEGGPAFDMNMDLPEEIGEVPPEVSAMPEADSFEIPDLDGSPLAEEGSAAESPASESGADASLGDFDMDGFEMPDLDASGFDLDSVPEADTTAPAQDDAPFPTESEDAPAPAGTEAAEDAPAPASPASDDDIFSTDGLDFSSDGAFDMGGDSFDMSDIGGLDLGSDGGRGLGGASAGEAGGSSSLDDFAIPDTDSQLNKAGDDFALESSGDDFSIPGFSEEGADPYAQNEKGGLDSPDFSGAVTGDGSARTSLTEDEYTKFKKNLSEFPLNVRIAVEEMISKNEFTDEVIFEVIDKVLKKVTARQLAGHLEKMLDISLPVPRDFERRSAEEYEAYKSSLAYQLKARILPAIIIGIFAAMILFCLGYLGHRYIYKPLKAEKLYREGYALLERDEYPQSEMSFNEALKFKSKKNWFFKYAQGYRAHKQFERAELFYKNILKRFDHDKQAGLEYAEMERDDLANYELAEEILKREVLDNHVNDPDGILALGDNYLEWATELDSSKYPLAYEQYSKLQQLYGNKNPDLYQSRILRYDIRTDQLRNVLQLKEFFYPREKSLGAADWTELSGYLMDKQYGVIPADQEYLRGKIEDVRDMMLFALKAAPESPVANYNLSRYLVQVGDHTKAKSALKRTAELFSGAGNLHRRDIYRQLNNYRLLGEEYLYDREYILAQTTFAEGLELFERRESGSKLEGDQNVGKMYADVGDIEYFISGDLESARRYYQKSVDNKNDNSSVRYRIGYIDYSGNKYEDALNNFIRAARETERDSHLMLALGNTLALKNDNFAAQGYYEQLLDHLDLIREKYRIEIPQSDPRAGDMVETYMKTSNNLGVCLFRLARQSGSSRFNASALVNFQDSLRYYDALTRNQETLVRLPGSNLAEQNLRYATVPRSDYEPEIYTEIPRVMDGEKGLLQ